MCVVRAHEIKSILLPWFNPCWTGVAIWHLRGGKYPQNYNCTAWVSDPNLRDLCTNGYGAPTPRQMIYVGLGHPANETNKMWVYRGIAACCTRVLKRTQWLLWKYWRRDLFVQTAWRWPVNGGRRTRVKTSVTDGTAAEAGEIFFTKMSVKLFLFRQLKRHKNTISKAVEHGYGRDGSRVGRENALDNGQTVTNAWDSKARLVLRRVQPV